MVLTVLLHGQPGSRLDWQLVLPLLDGLEVEAADRPGYDGTPAGGFYANARRLLDRTGDLPLLLVGYSWGAGVALAAAQLAPQRVRGLLLVAPVGSPRAVTRADELLTRRLPAGLFGLTMRTVGARAPSLFAWPLGSRLDRAARRALSAEVRSRDKGATWAAWQVEQRALVDETPTIAARLGEITAPAIVLAGGRDASVSPKAARDLAGRLPQCEYREIPAGHLIPFEAPAAVATAIRDLAARV